MNSRITTLLTLHLLTSLVLTGPLLTVAAQQTGDPGLPGYPARYMGGDAKLATAPNGAVIYDKALEAAAQVVYTEPTVEEIADGLWVIGGYSAANCCVLEAPDGLIVYDTGDNAEEGKHFREAIVEKISKEPIKAIVYSHSHYALGGGVMVDDPKSVRVIGHPKLVLQITVDQLRGDIPRRYYDRLGEGGFRYLMEEGTVYLDAHHRHANTETIVGHTTLATGADPSAHGMIGNVWLDRSSRELTYNVEDANYPLLTEGAGVDRATEIDPTQRAARTDGRSPLAILTFNQIGPAELQPQAVW